MDTQQLAVAAMALLGLGVGLMIIALHFRKAPNPLDRFKTQLSVQTTADQTTDSDSLFRAQQIALPQWLQTLAKPLVGMGESMAGSETDRAKLQQLLAMSGIRDARALGWLVSGKYLLGLILMGAALLLLLEPENRFSMNGVALGLMALFAGTLIPEMLLRWLSNQRGGRLAKALPDALDLMVICAEAGLPLGRILQVVSREMTLSAPEMADELRFTFAELQILNDRSRALLNLAERTGVSSIETMVATLVQAERYGTPLSQALRTISDETRKALVLTLEERAGRLPAQLSVPLMGLILPPIVAMMGAPAMVRIIRLLSE